ncbi:hypothetical protein VTG60DRAFT_3620 [Thermothelomyces hinnuleus]
MAFRSENPTLPLEWWRKAEKLKFDPTSLNITTYEAHSASKFNEIDFIHLKTVWDNRSVAQFNVREGSLYACCDKI